MASPKVVMPGGAGQLGSILTPFLVAQGYEVVILARPTADARNATVLPWDGRTLGPWAGQLEGAFAVINLAGRSVNCRYTRHNKRAMLASRVDSTRILAEAIGRCERPPGVWLNASTATIYQHSLHRPMDEISGTIAPTPAAKDAFSIEIATAWEAALFNAATPRTRKVALRTAIVLANHPDNMLTILRRLVHMGLGGPMGNGRQYVSWIHALDFCRAIQFLLERADLSGPVNLAAPNPLTNAQMMRILQAQFGRRFGLPAPRVMLEVGAFFMRTETELIIKSRRVIPTRLLQAGFAFAFPMFQGAVENLYAAEAHDAVQATSGAS